ncbi:MAG: NifB/NifX family molybdenum-iron cluster-binding protein [Desulfobulbaceae bacterium]|nr:NifB/NifX family molybdenum-iron cluster-binding protein [Desulfobulbaceae bacterium]HIJ79536.1 hypothetical protein [Deltaproteobacteria bacterium]
MRIAVVSNNGEFVDGSFGKTERILVYELRGAAPDLIEERNISLDLYRGDLRVMMRSMLNDCRQLYAADIDDQPAEDLIAAGIEPVIYDGPIVAIRNF